MRKPRLLTLFFFYIVGSFLMCFPIYAQKDAPLFISGIWQKGANTTEPIPARSQYLQVINGGVVVLPQGSAYYLDVKIIKKPASEMYIKIEYENPLNPEKPLVNEQIFSPDLEGFTFSSPDIVKGLTIYQNYKIKISVFANHDAREPIDVLFQEIRSYVDTTSSKVKIYKGLKQR